MSEKDYNIFGFISILALCISLALLIALVPFSEEINERITALEQVIESKEVKQMTAKDMFEKLGFECNEESNVIHYYNVKEESYVQFTKDVRGTSISTNEVIYMDLLQAINKQIEELGCK